MDHYIIIATIGFSLFGLLGAFSLGYVLPICARFVFNKILTEKKLSILIKCVLWYFFIGGAIGLIANIPHIMNDKMDRVALFGALSACLGICLGTGLRLFKK